MEEYPVPDISILISNKDDLLQLLYRLNHARMLKVYYDRYAKPEAEELRSQLTEIGTEMERKCLDFLDSYRFGQINEMTAKIKELTGISMSNALEK